MQLLYEVLYQGGRGNPSDFLDVRISNIKNDVKNGP